MSAPPRDCYLGPHMNSNIRVAENQQAAPLSRHRRRNVRSPAATDRALRELTEGLSSRPTVAHDVARVVTRDVSPLPSSEMKSIPDMPERHRCLPKCQDSFIVPDAGERTDTSVVVEKRREWNGMEVKGSEGMVWAAEIENVGGAEERGR